MPSIELPLGWPTILRAVIDGPGLWASPAEIVDRKALAKVYGKRKVALATVIDRCRDMIAFGWLEGIADGSDAVVTLSPRAADRLGVRAAAAGDRWQGFDLRRTPVVRYYAFTADELSVWFEVADPEPGPLERLIVQEELEQRARPSARQAPPSRARRGPGTGLHWIWLWRKAQCDHCRHVRLAERHYCLGCGRCWWEAP